MCDGLEDDSTATDRSLVPDSTALDPCLATVAYSFRMDNYLVFFPNDF